MDRLSRRTRPACDFGRRLGGGSGRRGRKAAVKTTQNERSRQPQNSSAEVDGLCVHSPRATAATGALEGCKEITHAKRAGDPAGKRRREPAAKRTVKQHLAAIRMLFDWLVTGGILASNPATSVRGPKHVIKRGKTPVLTTDQARVLIESIDTSTFVGLRDRALEGRFTLAPIFRSCRGG